MGIKFSSSNANFVLDRLLSRNCMVKIKYEKKNERFNDFPQTS